MSDERKCEHVAKHIDAGPYSDDIYYRVCAKCGIGMETEPEPPSEKVTTHAHLNEMCPECCNALEECDCVKAEPGLAAYLASYTHPSCGPEPHFQAEPQQVIHGAAYNVIQISEEAGRLLRELAKIDNSWSERIEIVADLLAETGFIPDTKQHKAIWRDGR